MSKGEGNREVANRNYRNNHLIREIYSRIMETRVNASGNKEVKIQPQGLPAIWVEMYCDRCREYQECLGLRALGKIEWEFANKLIFKVNSCNFTIVDLK